MRRLLPVWIEYSNYEIKLSMSGFRLILTYSARLVLRQWRRFVLPLLSLSITGIVLLLVLLLTSSGANLLAEQARALEGGDVVFESETPIDGEAILKSVGVTPEVVSEEISFIGTLASGSATAPFSVHAIDVAFPLYGTFTLANTTYRPLTTDEVLLAKAGADRLGVAPGDTVTFGDAEFMVLDIIVTEPTSLFGSFEFFPHVFMSLEGFARSAVDPALLRVEYSYAVKVLTLSARETEALRALEDTMPSLDVDIAGQDRRGLEFGLRTVSDFLVVAVLITAVLAAVNVYASTLYLVTVERKSLAILLALGLRKRQLTAILGTSLLYVVLLALMIALSIGEATFLQVQSFVHSNYLVALPGGGLLMQGAITFVLIAGVAFASFIPAVRQTLAARPRQVLLGEGATGERVSLRTIGVLTLATLAPLSVLAMYLLSSITDGLVVMLGIALVYSLVAGGFAFCVRFVYLRRARFAFFTRSIISQKKADGFFGIISFASLFVAIVALSTLTLLQVSLERFLVGDLQQTIPTTYVLDVQPSQKEAIETAFPDLELFSNIGARIIAIDDLQIQDELDAGNPDIDRELGREFSLTARTTLLSSEAITAGVWSEGEQGEISVDEEFAERASISLGSTLTFSIQGFTVSGTVTSMRSADSRSGLPFFYFVLSPEDIGQFPSVYFGYADYTNEEQVALGRFLATEFPNVSMIETDAIGPLVAELIATLLVLVLVVTVPPLLIATLLVATLVVSAYAERRRESARLRALGATQLYTFWQYVVETLSLTVLAVFAAYGVSVGVVLLINSYFLELDTVVLFATELFVGGAIILVAITSIAWYLFKTDRLPLRELLSYE
jgi:putative ABC transport system permease protein